MMSEVVYHENPPRTGYIHLPRGWVSPDHYERLRKYGLEEARKKSESAVPDFGAIEHRSEYAYLYADDDAGPIVRDVWTLIAHIRRLTVEKGEGLPKEP